MRTPPSPASRRNDLGDAKPGAELGQRALGRLAIVDGQASGGIRRDEHAGLEGRRRGRLPQPRAPVLRLGAPARDPAHPPSSPAPLRPGRRRGGGRRGRRRVLHHVRPGRVACSRLRGGDIAFLPGRFPLGANAALGGGAVRGGRFLALGSFGAGRRLGSASRRGRGRLAGGGRRRTRRRACGRRRRGLVARGLLELGRPLVHVDRAQRDHDEGRRLQRNLHAPGLQHASPEACVPGRRPRGLEDAVHEAKRRAGGGQRLQHPEHAGQALELLRALRATGEMALDEGALVAPELAIEERRVELAILRAGHVR